jgi:hypothetical protein
LLTETKDNLFYEHLNLGTPSGFLPDGRLSYWSTVATSGFTNPNSPTARRRANANTAFNNVLLLRNTSKGHTQNMTLSLEKTWADDWSTKWSYTYSTGVDVNPGTSSVSLSNWSSRLITNPNEELGGESNYIIRDRFVGVLNWKHDFIKDYATGVGMFYEGRAGRPFSYTFLGDANGDNANQDNDLFYIPAGPGDVQFLPGTIGGVAYTAQQIEDLFFQYANNDPYLSTHLGQVAGRNARHSPWINQFDVQFTQEIPSLFDNKGKVFFNIQNVGNLVNKKWGEINEVLFPYNVRVARFAGVNSAGRYVYQYLGNPQEAVRRDSKGQSRWAAQVGIRFEF